MDNVMRQPTSTELTLGITYEANHHTGNRVNSLEQVQFICYQNNDGGLLYTPYNYKGVIATKLLLNFANPRPKDPCKYKGKLRIKCSTTTTCLQII